MTDFDLVIKRARIDDDKDLVDIGISGGKISKIDKNLSAANVIDVNGDVVVPSFIESHIHLDKALLERVKPNLEGRKRQGIPDAFEKLANVIQNNEVVISHGNGPQVGGILLLNETFMPPV